jgi:hypothetical protein
MMVELFAIQGLFILFIIARSPANAYVIYNLEITPRDYSRRLFQGPPSNAIQSDFDLPSGESPLSAHHYPTRSSLTTFFLRFPLPLSSPAPVSFGLAQIRYTMSERWRAFLNLVSSSLHLSLGISASQYNASYEVSDVNFSYLYQLQKLGDDDNEPEFSSTSYPATGMANPTIALAHGRCTTSHSQTKWSPWADSKVMNLLPNSDTPHISSILIKRCLIYLTRSLDGLKRQ